MTTLNLVFCPECLRLLNNQDFLTYEWKSICELFAIGDPLLFNGGSCGFGEPMHRYLEDLGFIVSTEAPRSRRLIHLMPSYFEQDDCEYYFCAYPDQHSDEEFEDEEEDE